MTRRNRDKIKYNNISDENQIKSFIIILVIILVVAGIIYGLTEIFKKDSNDNNKNNNEITINYSKLTVGTIFSPVYDNYYVLVYNSKDTSAPKYSNILSRYVQSGKDNKIYFIDLNNGLNKEYYNKNNDNKSNKNAKTIDEFNFSDITLLEIKNKNIINYIDDYSEISKYLFN